MTSSIIYPNHPDSSGLHADAETGYRVLEALSTRSASAERCLQMIKIIRQLESNLQSSGLTQIFFTKLEVSLLPNLRIPSWPFLRMLIQFIPLMTHKLVS